MMKQSWSWVAGVVALSLLCAAPAGARGGGAGAEVRAALQQRLSLKQAPRFRSFGLYKPPAMSRTRLYEVRQGRYWTPAGARGTFTLKRFRAGKLQLADQSPGTDGSAASTAKAVKTLLASRLGLDPGMKVRLRTTRDFKPPAQSRTHLYEARSGS